MSTLLQIAIANAATSLQEEQAKFEQFEALLTGQKISDDWQTIKPQVKRVEDATKVAETKVAAVARDVQAKIAQQNSGNRTQSWVEANDQVTALTGLYQALKAAIVTLVKAHDDEKDQKERVDDLFHTFLMNLPSETYHFNEKFSNHLNEWRKNCKKTQDCANEIRNNAEIVATSASRCIGEATEHRTRLAHQYDVMIDNLRPHNESARSRKQFSIILRENLENTRLELIEKKVYTADEIAEAFEGSYAAMLDISLLRLLKVAMKTSTTLILFYPVHGTEFQLTATTPLFGLYEKFAAIKEKLDSLTPTQHRLLEQRLTHKKEAPQINKEDPTYTVFNLLEQTRQSTIDQRIMNQHDVSENDKTHFTEAFQGTKNE